MNYTPSKIFITEEAKNDTQTGRMLERMPGIPVEIIQDEKAIIRHYNDKEDAFTQGKRMVLLTRHKGKFFKPCPSVTDYVCCNYQIFHLAVGCNFDCSYCILQAYLNNPILTFYTNIEDALSELSSILKENPKSYYRIGTGELTDSLSTDHLTGFSEILVPFFQNISNATLEFKTKSDNIDNLLKMAPKEKVIVGWSYNSEKISQEEEHKTASLEKRLIAAKKVLDAGYKVTFHLDPIVHYEGWEKDYKESLDRLFDAIPPEKITWISMGSLRYLPKLKNVMTERFPKSKLAYGEFVRGVDDKMRYFKDIRTEMFQAIQSHIRSYSKDLALFLCMESQEVWQKTFGIRPTSIEEVSEKLDTQLIK